jgi:hypothetical protein
MSRVCKSLLGICILMATAAASLGQDQPARKLTPPLPGAKPLEVKERLRGLYSAVSKLNNTDTRDGIGVRWNWPKELGNQPWGAKGTVALVANPNEHVAFGKHRGFALRLVNRGKEPIVLRACDSAIYIVQEARDSTGRWREIENEPCSTCGNSYHSVALAANEYWEFSAPAYSGEIKTKIRFRLDASGNRRVKEWVYSNEFEGAVSKAQMRMAPTQVEIRKAFASKNAKDEAVVATLVELLQEDGKELGRWRLPLEAVERLGELGAAAKDAVPALRKVRDEKKGELKAEAAYALWRVNGNTGECLQTLIALLDNRDDESSRADAAGVLGRMGPAAKDAVPALCRAMENGDQRLRGLPSGRSGASGRERILLCRRWHRRSRPTAAGRHRARRRRWGSSAPRQSPRCRRSRLCSRR